MLVRSGNAFGTPEWRSRAAGTRRMLLPGHARRSHGQPGRIWRCFLAIRLQQCREGHYKRSYILQDPVYSRQPFRGSYRGQGRRTAGLQVHCPYSEARNKIQALWATAKRLTYKNQRHWQSCHRRRWPQSMGRLLQSTRHQQFQRHRPLERVGWFIQCYIHGVRRLFCTVHEWPENDMGF